MGCPIWKFTKVYRTVLGFLCVSCHIHLTIGMCIWSSFMKNSDHLFFWVESLNVAKTSE